jgi:uncharacterized protein YdhG (YjbR/CyaY superfamily)
MKAATAAVNQTVDSYFESLPENARLTLEKVRSTIKAMVPEAEEVISYGIPIFKHNGSLVGLGAAKNHCALYVMSPKVVDSFKDDFKKYDISKGTIRFPLDKPLPATLVKKIVKARLQENEAVMVKRKLKSKK